ncbi:hypothetical protein SAMN05421847_0428 [Halpernia humi]|uniref:Leucine-rich repeat domain-containing protein n=1 Tax=Halpernia humi TaxID=493375 RepID=A0A1H5TC05_9FLAO|nr:hypothetical protein [Halpernia humi]SEF60319.1 hypothetical protein SAMN05421847_0428 [Halpernia humi]
MKHHFGDFLFREDNYWSIIPNRDRYKYYLIDEIRDKNSVKIITIGKDSISWKQISDFPNLEELTLHEPTKEQIEYIRNLQCLKRLRITHARPKNIDFISNLLNLEEIVFEYVSGFSDLSPLKNLKKLKSLHFENLRKVSDFSGLNDIESLKYIRIDGTLDWNQPIDDFEFIKHLPNLEILSLGGINNKTEYPVFLPLLKSEKLKKILVMNNSFQTKEYAFLEILLPNVEGSKNELFHHYNGWIEFLGKKAGMFKETNPNIIDKCAEFKKLYDSFKIEAKDFLKNYFK